MPRHCCVPACKSNYNSSLKRDKPRSTFSFPKEHDLRKKWLSAISRADWKPTPYSSVCSLHFQDDDIVRVSRFLTADGTVIHIPCIPKLRENAVPSIFPRYSKVPSKKWTRKKQQHTESQESNQAAVGACKIGSDSGMISDNSNCLEHSNQVVVISSHGSDIGDRLAVHENDEVPEILFNTQIKEEVRSDDNRNIEESNLVRVGSSEVGIVDVLRTDKKDVVLENLFKTEIKEKPISDDVIRIKDSNSVGVNSHNVNFGDENDVVLETHLEPKIKEETINDDVIRIKDSNLIGFTSHEVVHVGEVITDENNVALETQREIEEETIINEVDRIEDRVDTRPVIVRTVDGEGLYITTEMGPVDMEELGFDDNTFCTSVGGEEILTDHEYDQAPETQLNPDGEQGTIVDNIEESNQADSVSSREVEHSLDIEDLCTVTEKDAYLDAIETIEKEYQYSTNEQDSNLASNTDSYTEILEDQIDLTIKVEEREVITIEDSDQEEPDMVLMQESLEDTALGTSEVITCVTCFKEILDCSCMLVAIRNKPLPMGTPHRALKSIPKGTLSTGVTHSKVPGIYAEKIIPQNVYFGPYEGQLDRTLDCHDYAWKLESGKLVDTSDEANSNYLRYVKFTPRVGLQNIYMCQHEGELYYRTTRDVKKNEQLYLYIDTKYHNNYYKPPKVQIEADIPTCTVCYLGFQTTQHCLMHESVCKFKIDDDLYKCCLCDATIKTVELLVAHEANCSSTIMKHGRKIDPLCEDICCNENVAKKKSVPGAKKPKVEKARIRDYILNRNAESISESPDDCNDVLEAPYSSPKKHIIEKCTELDSVDKDGTGKRRAEPQMLVSTKKRGQNKMTSDTDSDNSCQEGTKRKRNYWQVPRLYSMSPEQLTRYYQQREKKKKKPERKTDSQLNVAKSNEPQFDSEISRCQPSTISSFPQNDGGPEEKSVEENLDAVNSIECVYLQENNTGIDTFQPQFSITAPKKRGRPRGKSKSGYQPPSEQHCETAKGSHCSVYQGHKKNETCGCRPYLTVNSPPKKRGRPLGSKNRPKLDDQNSNDFINLRDLSTGTYKDVYQGHVVGMEMNRYQASEDPLLLDSVPKKRGRPLGSKNRPKGRRKGYRKIITQSCNEPLTSIEMESKAGSSKNNIKQGYEIDASIEKEPCEESSMNCIKENYEVDTNIEKEPCDKSSLNNIDEKYGDDAIIGEEPCDKSSTNRIKREYEIDAIIAEEPCDESSKKSIKEEYEVDAIIAEEPCDKSSKNSIKEEDESSVNRMQEEYEIDSSIEEEPCDESSVNYIKEKYEVDAIIEEEPCDESSTNSIKEEYEVDAIIGMEPCDKTPMNSIKEQHEIDFEEPSRAMQ